MRAFLMTIFRSFVGYMVLFACAVLILKRPPYAFSALDAVYGVTLVLLAGANAKTAARIGGARSARRTLLLHLVVGAAVWLGAQSVQVLQ